MSAPLTNQLGTGSIPADEEAQLVAEGTQFAAYWQPSRGEPILIASCHADIFARWAEQMIRQYDQEFGLPSQYRIPEHSLVPT